MPELITATADLTALAARLAEWIKAEGITGNYPADGIAARLVASLHSSVLLLWLETSPGYLRQRCERIKDHADLTPGERWAEDYYHGHRPGE